MFLTPDELQDLTGYQRPHKQVEWLRERQYPFELDAHGRPKVLKSHIERRLGAKIETAREPRLRLR